MPIQLKSTYLTVPVSNFSQSVEWYSEQLGFRVVKEDPFYIELVNESGIRILFQQNEHNLHSHFVYPDGALQSSYGFMVDDAEAAYHEFVERGIKVGQLFDYQGKSFSFYDPDGNFIEIWSPAQ
ncbi:VOC family protein [Paenibacillus lignilyticus]|uniref:VOC family protein n=1 Tax=Paenibacillus lignilyticus TaxID=1172615 RepID=A0ABS5CB82_9BACL|nr:VOC family protein [Paenibacillus lignilyticus]MBP3962705.1 VOC family protein [Paenibacillus lignilyticus]